MTLLRVLLCLVLVRPVLFIVFGVNIRHAQRLPKVGPAIVVANHNSHLDTLVLMSLFPIAHLHDVRPVAAADYFTRNRMLQWLTKELLHGIFISRDPTQRSETYLKLSEALTAGNILILYPEGSRGEPERLSKFKMGVTYLVERYPKVPVYPVLMHGLGKILPKNDWLPVPFLIDVFVGEPMHWTGDHHSFLGTLNTCMQDLAAEGNFPPWE